MKTILVLAVAIVCQPLAANDVQSRAAKALGLPCPLEARAVTALACDSCDCLDDASCDCDPAACRCCVKGAPPYVEVYAKVTASPKEGTVLVAFVGSPGHCVDGALCGTMPADAHGSRIAVGAVRGGTLTQVASLPITATREQVAAAVREAGRKGRYVSRQICRGSYCEVVRTWVPDP